MRRILAITLLIAFGSPLVLPALASPANAQRNLPACCRRNGAHHCNGLVGSGTQSGPAFTAPTCPNYPSPATPVNLNTAALAAPPAFAVAVLTSRAVATTARPSAQTSVLSSNLLRGPPALA